MGYIEELRAVVGKRPLFAVGAGVCVLDHQNRVLLQRRGDNGLWSCPGGGLEPGESFEQAARRELREETGLEVGALQFFSLTSGADFFYTYPNGDQVYFVSARFVTREVWGELKADGLETLELRYFALDDLPPVTVNDQTHLPRLRDKILRGEL